MRGTDAGNTAGDAGSLLALLDEFHITDRAIVRARDRLRRGDARAVEALKQAAAKYFGDMAAESRERLAAIDRKLDDLYQRQYNLQAERSVSERRLSGALRVLGWLDQRDASAQR